jgi:hypothetical protein
MHRRRFRSRRRSLWTNRILLGFRGGGREEETEGRREGRAVGGEIKRVSL